jgi:hypothetical protein
MSIIAPIHALTAKGAAAAIYAADHVQVEVLKVHARVNDGYIDVNPPIIDAVNVNVCVGVGENALDPGGNSLAKDLPDLIAFNVLDVGVHLQGGHRLCGHPDGKTLQRVLVDVANLPPTCPAISLDAAADDFTLSWRTTM